AVAAVPEGRGPVRVEAHLLRQVRAGVEVEQVARPGGRAGGESGAVDDEFEPGRGAGQGGVGEGCGQFGQGGTGQRGVHDDRHVDVTASVPVVAEREGAVGEHAHRVWTADRTGAVDQFRQVRAHLRR